MDNKNHRKIKCGKGYMRITNKESTIELMVVSQKKIQNKTWKPRVFQAEIDREAVYFHWTDFMGRKGGVRSGDSGTAGQDLGVGKSGGASRKWIRAHQAGTASRSCLFCFVAGELILLRDPWAGKVHSGDNSQQREDVLHRHTGASSWVVSLLRSLLKWA